MMMKKSFIYLINQDNFNEKSLLKSDLYPIPEDEDVNVFQGYTFLELCCYHGASHCFKILISALNVEITPICLQFSFLSGNPEIISECLKEIDPNEKCMHYAIIAHNTNFIEYLANNYGLNIDLDCCATHFNIQALIIYLDQTKRVNKTFIY